MARNPQRAHFFNRRCVIRLSDTVMQTIADHADAMGMPRTQWVREVVITALERETGKRRDEFGRARRTRSAMPAIAQQEQRP
jgi:hypothetical protein